MTKRAQELKYDYIGISEHNPSVSKHTSEQIYTLLQKRNEEIEQINESNKDIRILKLLEIDILANGELAIDDKSLSLLDAGLVSIHSVFSMDRSEMTKRVLAGLSHPKAKILTHPTGRLLNQRAGYELDWDAIFSYCRDHHKAIEINSWPQRLDLPDTLIFDALKYGVKFVINTDSHALTHMDLMQYGISVARRGWATKSDILNTLPYNKLIEWLKM
jgi:DNA polymerase (family X)